MTVLSSNDTNLSQNNSDTNLSQSNSNENLSQKKEEVTKQSAPEAEQQTEDPNWRALRESRKKEREEKKEAERRAAEKEAEVQALKAAMEAAFSKQAPTPQAYQQYYGMNQEAEETEEQRIERKVSEIISKKEQEYAKQQQEFERQEYPNRLRRDFPDFNKVCDPENLDYLDYHYPEVSRPLQRLQEGYDKWHDIYHAVKKFIPNHSTAKKEAMKADMNSQKPKSISSPNLTPPGQPTRETWQEVEQRRAAAWQRMQRTMKGVG